MKAFANGLKRFMAVIFTVVLIADLVPAEALVMNIYATESGSVAAGNTSGDNVTYPSGGSESDNENNDSNISGGGSSTESENDDSNTSSGTSSDNGNDSSTTSGDGNDTESNDSNTTNNDDSSSSTTGGDESGTTGKTESGTTGKTESGTTGKTESAKPTVTVKPETKLAGDDQKKDGETPPEDATTSPSISDLASGETDGSLEVVVGQSIKLAAKVTMGTSAGQPVPFVYQWTDGENSEPQDNQWTQSEVSDLSYSYAPETAGHHTVMLHVRNLTGGEVVSEPILVYAMDALNLDVSDNDNIEGCAYGSVLSLTATMGKEDHRSSYILRWYYNEISDEQEIPGTYDKDTIQYEVKQTGVTHKIIVAAYPTEEAQNAGIDRGPNAEYSFTPTTLVLEDIVDNNYHTKFVYTTDIDEEEQRNHRVGRGESLEFDFNNDEPKAARSYTVELSEAGADDWSKIAPVSEDDDTVYQFSTQNVGCYDIRVTCTSLENNDYYKVQNYRYIVYAKLSLSQKDDAPFEKVSDGNDSVILPEGRSISDYFELTGFSGEDDSDQVSFSMDSSVEVKYETSDIGDDLMVVFGEGSLDKITVYYDEETTLLYEVTELVSKEINKIAPIEPVELDTITTSVWPNYGISVTDTNYINKWFNIAWTKDDSSTFLVLDKNTKFVTSDNKEISVSGLKNAALNNGSGTDVRVLNQYDGKDFFITIDVETEGGKKSKLFYGPVTIKYQIDNVNPTFNGIAVDPDESTGAYKDKFGKPSIGVTNETEYKMTESGALLVVKGSVKVSVPGEGQGSGTSDVGSGVDAENCGVALSTSKCETESEVSKLKFTASVSTNTTGIYYIYTKHADIAGNVTYRCIDGTILNDQTAPVAEVELSLDSYDESSKLAKGANISFANVKDIGTGFYSIDVILYDGVGDEKTEYDSFNVYKADKFEDLSGNFDETKEHKCTVDSISLKNHGAYLSVLVVLEDLAGNTTYYGLKNCNGEKTTLQFLEIESAENYTVTDADTFNIVAEDAAVNINVGKDKAIVREGTYIVPSSEEGWKPNITFTHMPVSTFEYKWNSTKGSTIDLLYSVDEHCFVNGKDNNPVELEVQENENSLAFNLHEYIKIYEDGNLYVGGSDDLDYNEAFIYDSIAPVVELTVSSGKTPNKKGNTYYYGLENGISGNPELNVKAEITEEHWYEVDAPKLVVYKDGEIDKNLTKEFKKDGGKYSATITIIGDDEHTTDGKYQFIVGYVNESKSYHNYRKVGKIGDTNYSDNYYLEANEPEASSITYVIDTTRPDVKYSIDDSVNNQIYTENGEEICYYNKTFTESFEVTDENIDKGDVVIAKRYKSRLDTDIQNRNDIHTLNESFTADKDGVYWYEISGQDLAGNKLSFDIKTTATNTDLDSLKKADATGEFETQKKVRDTTAPQLTYSITKLEETHQYDDGDYYNKAFTVTFTVDEINFDDNRISVNKLFNETEISLDKDGYKRENDSYTYEIVVTKDQANEGEYKFCIEGRDRANNTLVFNKDKSENLTPIDPTSASVIKKEGKDGKTYEVGSYITGKKVLDITAPKYSVTEMTEPASAENVDGDRVYFNKNISVKFKVTDSYLDDKKIKATIASNKGAGNYEKDEVTWSDLSLNEDDKGSGNTTEINRSLSVSATKDHSNDGIYRFEIAGEDKAGNKLVRAEKNCDINNKAYNRTEPHGDGIGEFWTMIKVIDTVAPQGEITIGKYYIADLKAPKVLEVKTSEPYRKETSASGTVKVTSDKSPVKIAYPLTSQVGGRSQGKLFGDYKYNNSASFSTQGEQVFFLTVTLTDRAGNTTGPIKTNSIYLDVTPPTEDTLAPSISIVANANSSAHGPAGNPLFSSSVPISVVVSDPNATARSSGLAEISYEILVDGQVKNTGILNQKGTTKWNGKYNDPSLTYKISKSVTADSSLNSNNIVIRVKAADNSGNTSQKEYNFGIDITAPKISVTYDNNDVQNEKYFKADRTATIVVTERNFDPSRINITTNGGSQSDWSFSNNGGNGDNDTWTKRITYGSDGDYTFGVTGSDLLGHQASDITYNGAAPREFTVDKTIPVISISFDIGQGYKGSKYFNETRTGTVTIVEHNFRASDARVDSPGSISRGEQPSASQGGWSDSGDNHYMSIVFDQDGDYTITANYKDLAGNVALVATADEFTIDKTKPEIEFDSSTVQANHAYQGVIAPRITFSDTNYDPEGVTFTLTGIKDSRGKVLKLTEVFSDETGYGGSISYENFANIRANDDIYTATGIIVDRAGNQSEVTITFSVNRFGSTWDYNDDKTTEGLIHRYTNEEKDVYLREINVNEVTEYSIFMTHDSDVVELKEGTDYEVKASEATGWKQYVYKFYKKNFEAEGTYNIVVQTKDAAGNSNTNSSMKNENGSEAVPLQYSVDKTCPYATLDGVDLDEKLYNQAALDLFVKVFDALSGVYKVEIFIYPNNAPEDAAERTAPAYKYENTEKDNALERVLLANNDEIPFTIGQHNSPQTVKVVTYDAAGNISEMIYTNGQTVKGEILWDGVLVSTNVASQVFYNRPLFIGLIAVLLLLLLILFLIWRRRKNQENLAG